jgi:hypothetical protein
MMPMALFNSGARRDAYVSIDCLRLRSLRGFKLAPTLECRRSFLYDNEPMFCAKLGFSLTPRRGTWSLPSRLPRKVNQARSKKNAQRSLKALGGRGKAAAGFWMRRIYLHLPGVVWGEILIYGFFFGVGDGVGVGGASVDGAAAISPSFAPAASTSFVVISSLVKGAMATTLQTRGISPSDAKGAFNQTFLDIAVTIKPILGCSCTESIPTSNPRFRIAFCDPMRLVCPGL